LNEAAAMRLFVVCVVGALLVSCHQRKPVVSDRDYAMFKASFPGMTQRCLNDYRYGGHWGDLVDRSDCFDMMPAQRWSGLWEHGWEWTNFCPDPAKECEWMSKRGIWLKFAEGARPKSDIPWGLYRIEFVGRRTKVRGNFGHTNAYDHLMVVDRLISIKTIPGEKYTKVR